MYTSTSHGILELERKGGRGGGPEKGNTRYTQNLTGEELENAREDEDGRFLEAKEEEESGDDDQHQQCGHANEKGAGAERVVEDGIKVGEAARTGVSRLVVVGVAVLEHSQVAIARAGRGVSDPLRLNEGDEVEDAPNDGQQTPQHCHRPILAHVAKVVGLGRIGVEFRIHTCLSHLQRQSSMVWSYLEAESLILPLGITPLLDCEMKVDDRADEKYERVRPCFKPG